jgi:hypothetical protein
MYPMVRSATVLTILIVSLSAFAAGDAIVEPLFAESTALEIDFELALSRICRNPESGTCKDLPGAISYLSDDGSRVRIDVKVRTRGRWSTGTSGCTLPALMIYFDPDQTRGTIFEGQRMLPFTTHCRHDDSKYQAYTLSEFVGYRIYNLITPASLKVRLVHVAYHDKSSKLVHRRYGFFTEHFKSAARRLDAQHFEVDELDPRATDSTDQAVLSVFQFMIGNLDWSVVRQHNIVLFRNESGTIIPTPYDFDYSGLVNAEYARPPDFLKVRTVRHRLYRGYCLPGTDWDRVFARFTELRQPITQLTAEVEGMSWSQRRRMRAYLEQFWTIISSEEKRRVQIIDACRHLPQPDMHPSKEQ